MGINFIAVGGANVQIEKKRVRQSGAISIRIAAIKPQIINQSTFNIQIVHYIDHGYIEEEKSMIHSFTAFGAKYLTSMVTSASPYETFSLI